MPTKLQQEAINNIMNCFNFKKVHEYMKSVRWTWAGHGPNEYGVPTITAIMKEARKLLEEACNTEDGMNYRCISTGGLLAIRHGQICLELHFVIEDWFEDTKPE